jgi:hypothetical protein
MAKEIRSSTWPGLTSGDNPLLQFVLVKLNRRFRRSRRFYRTEKLRPSHCPTRAKVD